MGILGIKNRTENWKTVQHFHGLCDAAKVTLVRRLGEPEDTVAKDIEIELFWYGIRDYKRDIDLVQIYRCLFPCLREKISRFEFKHSRGLELPMMRNYTVPTSREDTHRLVRNLTNTEIDIVLETPNHIYVGEAKFVSTEPGRNGSYILVHQLIRQYVTARILVHLTGAGKVVVPFVVTADTETMRRRAQVEFMIGQKWLCKKNVLAWGEWAR